MSFGNRIKGSVNKGIFETTSSNSNINSQTEGVFFKNVNKSSNNHIINPAKNANIETLDLTPSNTENEVFYEPLKISASHYDFFEKIYDNNNYDFILYLQSLNYSLSISECNEIFYQFSDNPKLFKTIFGYDMYVTDGNGKKKLNYNALMFDAFINECGFSISNSLKTIGLINNQENSANDNSSRLERFLKSKNLKYADLNYFTIGSYSDQKSFSEAKGVIEDLLKYNTVKINLKQTYGDIILTSYDPEKYSDIVLNNSENQNLIVTAITDYGFIVDYNNKKYHISEEFLTSGLVVMSNILNVYDPDLMLKTINEREQNVFGRNLDKETVKLLYDNPNLKYLGEVDYKICEADEKYAINETSIMCDDFYYVTDSQVYTHIYVNTDSNNYSKDMQTVVTSLDNVQEKTPQLLDKHLNEIVISGIRNPQDAYWSDTHGNDFYSSATGGGGNITFYNEISDKNETIDTIYHEMGHTIDNEITTEGISDSNDWINAIKNDNNFVSDYARESAEVRETGKYQEDFADSILILNNIGAEEFTNNYPNRAQVLKDIIPELFIK